MSVETVAPPRETPSKLKRLEEREELRELNNRLEFCILKQRQREAEQAGLLRQLSELKAKQDAEQAAAKAQHDKEIAELRAANDRVSLSYEAALREIARYKATIDGLEGQVATSSGHASLNTRIKQLTEEIQNVNTLLQAAQEAQRHDASAVATLQADLDGKKDQIAYLRKSLEDARGAAAASAVRAAKLEADMLAERERNQRDAKELEERLARLSAEGRQLESRLRDAFAKQLQENLMERQEQFEAEKEELQKELQNRHYFTLAQLNKQTDSLGTELDLAKRRVLALEKELEARGRSPASDQQIAELQLRISEKERQLELQRNAHAHELAKLHSVHDGTVKRLEARIAELEGKTRSKDNELSLQRQLYDDLYTAKVALDMEIKAYRLLLENEEARLGSDFPALLRKIREGRLSEGGLSRSRAHNGSTTKPRAPLATGAIAAAAATAADDANKKRRRLAEDFDKADQDEAEEQLEGVRRAEGQHRPEGQRFDGDLTADEFGPVISGVDLGRGVITVVNEGPRCALSGWSLRSKAASHKFILPDVNLASGETIELWVDAKLAPTNSHVWLDGDHGKPFCEPNGDELSLSDSEGNIVCEAEVRPEI